MQRVIVKLTDPKTIFAGYDGENEVVITGEDQFGVELNNQVEQALANKQLTLVKNLGGNDEPESPEKPLSAMNREQLEVKATELEIDHALYDTKGKLIDAIKSAQEVQE